MAHRGQVLDNPISGERFVFHRTARETGGELLEFELVLAPGGRVPGGHVHPVQEEWFEVVSGRMRFRTGLRTVVATPGDSLVVPPRTYHRFANAGDGPAVVRVSVRPALDMERLYETVVALTREGRTLRSGMPRPLDLALFLREFTDEVRAPVAPGLVRVVTAPLAWMATRRGLDRRYPRLSATRASAPAHPGDGRVSGTRPEPSRPSLTRPGRPGGRRRRRRPDGRDRHTG